MPGPHYGPCSLKMLAARYGDSFHIECYRFIKWDDVPTRYSFKIDGEWVDVDYEAWTVIRNLRCNAGQERVDAEMMNCIESLLDQQKKQEKIASDLKKVQITLDGLGKRR